jgi:thiol-disulfide isomerase/thioredoxin
MRNTKHLIKIFSFIFWMSLPISGFSQNIPVIGLDNLESRLDNGSDTTYVVNFWATWCGPCVKELPYFEALEKANQGKKFKVLLVSLDFVNQLESKVVPFLERKKLISEVVLMDEDRPNKWIPRVSEKWTGALPATLFVNTKKKTRHFHEGSFKEGELEQKLTEIGL